MKAFSLVLVITLAVLPWTLAYNAYPRNNYAASYTATASSSASASVSLVPSCCELNSWALSHLDEVKQMSERIKQEYNAHISKSKNYIYRTPWRENIVHLTGQTANELDELARSEIQQLRSDVRNGNVNYGIFNHPQFWEYRASQLLQSMQNAVSDLGQQQQQQLMDFSQYPTEDLSGYDKVETYTAPAELKIIDGRPYIVHQNLTKATKNYNSSVSLNDNIYQSRPSSTLTKYQYNKTIIRKSDGMNSQYDAESQQKWIMDDKSIYEDSWKNDERLRMFWLFSNDFNTAHKKLISWQNREKDRLRFLAQQQHCSLDEIRNWQQQELERYNSFLEQYRTQSTTANNWQTTESARLAWLIHKNSVTPESFAKWQQANINELRRLASKQGMSLQDFKVWQLNELNRLYNSIGQRQLNAESLRANEDARLAEIMRDHDAAMRKVQNSIELDKQKLTNLSQTYQHNSQDYQNWLRQELQRIASENSAIHSKVENASSWLQIELQQQQSQRLAALTEQYKQLIRELETKQQMELQRVQNAGQQQFNEELKDWQRRETERLQSLTHKNDATIAEIQAQIHAERVRLNELLSSYKMQVNEVQGWLLQEINKLKSEDQYNAARQEIEAWQQQERQRFEELSQQNALTVRELTEMINNDQSVLYSMANKYQLDVEAVQQWLKQELTRLQSEGVIEAADLQEWQKAERENILNIVRENKLTIEQFEEKFLRDKEELAQMAKNYKVQTAEMEAWIKQEGERLQQAGMLQMKQQLNDWQQIERQRLLNMLHTSNLSMTELEQKIQHDHAYLHTLAQQHRVEVEDIQQFIKQEIQKLQQEGLVAMSKLKDWQLEWKGNLTAMITERDFTVEEFHKWLLEDRKRLENLAQEHNVRIEELEQWVKNEEQSFVNMGLLKPNEKLTNWQEVERLYLERIAAEQYHSTAQLEQRLRQDRQLMEQLARNYSVQVEEVNQWMRKELARMRDEGQLQIDNLTAWQLAERQRLEQLTREKQNWSSADLQTVLYQNSSQLQRTAFQYHTSVDEIEQWLRAEIERLQAQGKLNIENLSAWQTAEQKRILNLLQQSSLVTAEQFEQRLQKDQAFMRDLAREYQVAVSDIEAFVKQVVGDLRQKGRFEVEQLQNWQVETREHIKSLMEQQKGSTNFATFKKQLLRDQQTLYELSQKYHVSVDEVQKWMIEELKRLRLNAETDMRQLANWQKSELERLKSLIRENAHLSYVEFEAELLQERTHLQKLARQYKLSVEQIKDWLRQQLVNLKTTGEIEVENLSKWQTSEQKQLIGMLLAEHQTVTEQEFEQKLQQEQARLSSLASKYSVSVEQIEQWMRDELQRLKDSGLVQVAELNDWQIRERERLENWLNQKQNMASYADFNEYLKQDKKHMAEVAQEYQVTVEQMEGWLQQEAARLQILGRLQPTESWKFEVLDQLKYAVAAEQVSNTADVERFLVNQHASFNSLAQQEQVELSEIEEWVRQEARNVVSEQGWMKFERENIESLLEQRPNSWSIEELERHLLHNRQHLQNMANNYQQSVEEIRNWYRQQLQELLQQQRIYSENLTDWQRLVKERMFNIVVQQPGLTVSNLRNIIFADKNNMNRVADTYHLNIEELMVWMTKEVNRLKDLGYVSEINNAKAWQEEERKRLRQVVKDLLITYEELYEFISNDKQFEAELAQTYGTTLSQLAPVQSIELTKMKAEGLFDQTQLLRLEDWQKTERDRLYNMITTKNFSFEDLIKWQSQGSYYEELAKQYGISVKEQQEWHVKEYKRLMRVADLYRMTLKQLETFRQEEIDLIIFMNHKKLISLEEQTLFEEKQEARNVHLSRKSGQTEEQLIIWRRTLYLLSQGLIPLNTTEEYGGRELGPGSTKRTGAPQQEISKDRGDQPPTVYYQDEDADEPGLAGENYPYGPGTPEKLETDSRIVYPGPSNNPGGYRYSKSQTKYIAKDVTKRGVADIYPQQQQQEELEDFGQQQQVDLGWNTHNTQKQQQQQQQQEQLEDFGQQQQVDLGWNAHNTQKQQQQQQVDEDYSLLLGVYTRGEKKGLPKSNEDLRQKQQVEDFGQQQQQVEDFGQQQQQVEEIENFGTVKQMDRNGKQTQAATTNTQKVEVQAEPESPGFFTNLKNKIFG